MIKTLGSIFLLVLGVSFIWYVRSYLILGNPVYPFFYKFFGGHGWYKLTGGIGEGLGFGKGIFLLFLAPWNITMFPAKFGGEQLGIGYLMFLTFITFSVRKSPKIIRMLLVISGIYFLLWFFIDQNLRFLFPVLPFLSILVSFVFHNFQKGGRKVYAIMLMIIFLNFSIAIYHSLPVFEFIFQGLNKHEFLMKKERSYRGWKFLNDLDNKDSLVLTTEPRLYYSEMPAINMNTFIKSDGWAPEVVGKAKYLMLRINDKNKDIKYLKHFSKYKLLFSYKFKEGDTIFDYYIYKIMK
jgi:hypothetical protein